MCSRTCRILLAAAAIAAVLAGGSPVARAVQPSPVTDVQDREAPPGLTPQILLIFSDDASQTWIQEMTVGLHLAGSRAGETAPAWFLEYLDAVRFQHGYARQFRAAIREKYRGRRLDLIVAVASNAISLVDEARSELFPDVPVLFVNYGGGVVPNTAAAARASGLVFGYGLEPALATLTTVFPDLTTLVVTSGTSPVERVRESDVSSAIGRTGLRFVDLAAPSLAEAVARVATLPDHSVLFVAGGQIDPDGRVTPSWQLCERLSAAANRPTMMLGAQFLGCGIVGGMMRDYTKIGQVMGERAIAAATAAHSGVEVVPFADIAATAFDARQLERWGVDERRLPAGSIVRFRPPSLWRDYRNAVLFVVAMVVVQSLLLAVLLFERRQRRTAEMSSRRSLELAAHVERKVVMTALTGSIAHELIQPLSSILHNAEVAETLVATNRATPEELREILRDIRHEDNRATQIVQRHRAMLKKHALEQRPIVMQSVVRESLALVAHDALRRQVQIDAQLPEMPSVVAGDQVLLQQVVVNLVMNAMDAMDAMPVSSRRVVVRQEITPEAVEISVRDLGPGLPAEIDGLLFEPFVTTKPGGIGIGLAITRTIVEAHHGAISARNNADGGATFSFILPTQVTA